MKKFTKIISILLVFVFVFNAPLNVFAQMMNNQLVEETHECEIGQTNENRGSIPDNALLLRGKPAVELYENLNREISLYSLQHKTFDQETFSMVIFNTAEERDKYVAELNSIAKDLVSPDQVFNMSVTSNDVTSFMLQNVNNNYSGSFDIVKDSTKTVVYVVTLDTLWCEICELFKPVIDLLKFLGDVSGVINGIIFVVNITKTLLCTHTIRDTYQSQTSCPYSSYCMGTPYLVQDNNGSAVFACTCGATWNVWY